MSNFKTIHIPDKQSRKYLLIGITFLVIIIGLFLRVLSFSWNDRLHGDVNLFALTAREYVSNSRLYYPMKYEYSDNVPYLVLESPASQHPPLWPFVAGLFGKLFSTDDTFTILKVLSLVSGFALIAMIAYGGFHNGWWLESLLAIIAITISPLIVDFSTNGSFYIFSSVLVTLAFIVLYSFNYRSLANYVFAGVLCGIGILIHSLLVFLVIVFLVFWLWNREILHREGLLVFSLSIFIVIFPFIIWNMIHFGRLIYSYASFHILNKLGLTRTGIFENVISTRFIKSVDITILSNYISLMVDNIKDFSSGYFFEVGIFCIVLTIIGVVVLINQDFSKALAFILPFTLYCLVIFLWPSYKNRFIVPLLPLTYIAAAFGFSALIRNRMRWKIVGVILFAGMIVWGLPSYFLEEPTKYYEDSLSHAENYSRMKDLASEMTNLDPGTVLGYSNELDGGIETIYFHRLPFVYGSGFKIDEMIKLVRDFNVRYIWTDNSNVGTIKNEIPEANLILSNDLFLVFDLVNE